MTYSEDDQYPLLFLVSIIATKSPVVRHFQLSPRTYHVELNYATFHVYVVQKNLLGSNPLVE